MGQLAGQLGSQVAGQRRAANRAAVGTVATWLAAYVAHTQELWWGVRGVVIPECRGTEEERPTKGMYSAQPMNPPVSTPRQKRNQN